MSCRSLRFPDALIIALALAASLGYVHSECHMEVYVGVGMESTAFPYNAGTFNTAEECYNFCLTNTNCVTASFLNGVCYYSSNYILALQDPRFNSADKVCTAPTTEATNTQAPATTTTTELPCTTTDTQAPATTTTTELPCTTTDTQAPATTTHIPTTTTTELPCTTTDTQAPATTTTTELPCTTTDTQPPTTTTCVPTTTATPTTTTTTTPTTTTTTTRTTTPTTERRRHDMDSGEDKSRSSHSHSNQINPHSLSHALQQVFHSEPNSRHGKRR